MHLLLNNRNSRLHLFIDRCMVKTKKGNKIQDIAKTAAHITKITFTVPNSEIILTRSSSDLFCTAVLLSPRLDCLEIPPVSFYLILHWKGTNFNLSNIARAIYKKSSFHLLTFKFVPLTISLLLSVDLHPGRSLLAQAPVAGERTGALLCLLAVNPTNSFGGISISCPTGCHRCRQWSCTCISSLWAGWYWSPTSSGSQKRLFTKDISRQFERNFLVKRSLIFLPLWQEL